MSHDPLIGNLLGGYRIDRLLGTGTVSSVYLGYHHTSGYEASVKVLPANFLPRDLMSRLEVELRQLARLEHNLIVQMRGAGRADGMVYIITEHIPGLSLSDRLASQGPMTPEQALPIIQQVADALDHAHKRGIQHLNLKPSNILIDDAGLVYLLDFGIPVLQEVVAQYLGLPVRSSPAYIAPEVVRGAQHATPAVDIYALGTILFEMLTGHRPFEAISSVELLMMHLNKPVPSLRSYQPDIAPAVEAVVTQAMAKSPRDRFARTVDIASALAVAINPLGEAGEGATQQGIPSRGVRSNDAFNIPRLGVQPRDDERSQARAEFLQEQRHRYDPSLVMSHLSPRERRRVTRQQERERKLRTREARRAYGEPTLLQRMAAPVGITLIVIVVVGAILVSELQRRSGQAAIANAEATNSLATATSRARATATFAALSDAMTATHGALAALPVDEPRQTPTTPPSTATLIPQPTPFGGSGGYIAYVAERDGDPDIFVYSMVSGQEIRVTENDVIDASPAWSPDGDWLAYSSEDADEGQQIFVLDVACLEQANGCLGRAIQLTSGNTINTSPLWSDNSRSIVFVSARGGDRWLRVVGLDRSVQDLMRIFGDLRLMAWAPGEQSVIANGVMITGSQEVMQVPLSGVFGDRQPVTGSGGAINFLSYSPDYQQAVYVEQVGDVLQLYLAESGCRFIEDCTVLRLTDDAYNYTSPRFSPDGLHILASVNRSGNYDLVVLDREGRIIYQLTDQPYDEVDAVWQPGR